MKNAILAMSMAIAAATGVAAATSAAPDGFLPVPANPDFAFARALGERPDPGVRRGNAPGGEKSPVADAFWMAKTPVTNAEWARFTAETKHAVPTYWKDGKSPNGKENHPVVRVSRAEAEAYCEWLDKKNPGWTFRLPTEAEWEWAATGNERRRWPWGDKDGIKRGKNGALTAPFTFNAVVADRLLRETPSRPVRALRGRGRSAEPTGEPRPLSSIISVSDAGRVTGWMDHANDSGFVRTDLFRALDDAGGETTPVDAHPEGASPFGILDMAGNTWEWTSSEIEATNGAERGRRVAAVRGGSWYATRPSCEPTFRGEGRDPALAYNTVGFRVVAVREEGGTGRRTGRSGMADGAKRIQSASTTATLLDKRIVRLSRVTVDPARLTEYVAFATECGRASMAREPGVLFMYSMSDKKTPNIVTILEIYADESAYSSHIATAHFRKYKQATLDMVQKLELLDQTALIPGMTMKVTQ